MALVNNGNFHCDGLTFGDFIEIDVEDVVLNWVELDFTHNGLGSNTVDFKIYSENVWSVNQFAYSFECYGKFGCYDFTFAVFLSTVENAGDASLVAEFA